MSKTLPWPEEDYSALGTVEESKLPPMQRHVGRVMDRNWTSIPHVTHHDEVDITGFEQQRQRWNTANPEQKRTLLPVMMKAAVHCLQEYPQFNCSLGADGSTLYSKKYFHIGFAADVPNGLLVPVVRDCDQKSVAEIASTVSQLSEKARGKGLAMTDMSGGCFTLSSLGHIGGTGFTPIINAPEVAILGITRAQPRFMPNENMQPELRQLLPLSLSYDHRVINGSDAARFVRSVGQFLQDYEFG